MTRMRLDSKWLAGMMLALPILGCATDLEGPDPGTEEAAEALAPEAAAHGAFDPPESAFPDVDGEEVAVELPFENGRVSATGRVVDDGRVVVMGDVVLSRRLLDARSTNVSLGRRWPDARIVYDVQGGSDPRVTGAIGIWAQQTNITFRYRTNEADYVHVELGAAGTGCYTDFIGKQGGKQTIHLAPECTQGNTIHEFGHVIGLSHEQARTDRNSFIKVDYTQVKTGNSHNFDTIDGSTYTNASNFDFGSVMMYDSYAFATGSNPTMTRLDGTTWTSQRAGLSDTDRGAIWWMYRTSATSGIRARFDQLGGVASYMGWPVTGEYLCPDGIGWYVHFQDGGSIYWSPSTGARTVHGAIRARWAEMGWERSFLGYPVTDELLVPDGTGFYNHFQGGSIYWSAASGAHEIYGLIRDKWAQLGWERSTLGYPTTGETGTPDGIGRYNHFERGSIYWTPATGAWKVDGQIRDKWAQLGWERSCLGYPTGDAYGYFTNGGRYLGLKQNFQRGTITAYDSGGTSASCSN